MKEYRFSLEEEEYMAFSVAHAFHTPQNKRTMLVARALLPCIFLIIFFVVVNRNVSMEAIKGVTGAILLVASLWWVVFFERIIGKQLRKNILKLKKAGKLPYEKNTCLQFHEDHIMNITPDGELKIAYTKIENIIIAPLAIYIYINVAQAIVLPRRVFANVEDQAAILRLLEEKTGKIPKRRGK